MAKKKIAPRAKANAQTIAPMEEVDAQTIASRAKVSAKKIAPMGQVNAQTIAQWRTDA